MSSEEFIELYINAPEEVQKAVEQTLNMNQQNKTQERKNDYD